MRLALKGLRALLAIAIAFALALALCRRCFPDGVLLLRDFLARGLLGLLPGFLPGLLTGFFR